MKKSWRCPHCGGFATIRREDQSVGNASLEGHTASVRLVKCPNASCEKVSVYASYTTYECETDDWQLVPEAGIRSVPDYVPRAIADDYREACLVKEKSPKASATLARRCMQGMIRDFWGISGGSLFKEIDSLDESGNVDPQMIESINAVRRIGNIGAHMEKDVSLIVDVEPDEAELLLQLLDSLIDDWYVARHEREKRAARLKAIVAEKDAARASGRD